MSNYSQGIYQPTNPSKYIGKGTIRYRSSWELFFMRFLDNNPAVLQWASEEIRIPYVNPLTGKNTNYVPDFFIYYQDANGQNHAELIEIKPSSQTSLSEAKGIRDQASALVNMYKWKAAEAWSKAHNISFRVITEQQLFKQGSKRK